MTTDAQLREHAVSLVLALMASASTDNISPKSWWDRATSALLTGATKATLGECVDTMRRKLQIESLRASSSNSISSLEASIGDWESLRRVCEREAGMVIALARVRRQREREEAGEIREYQRPIEAQLANATDRVRALEAKLADMTNKINELEADKAVLRNALEGTK